MRRLASLTAGVVFAASLVGSADAEDLLYQYRPVHVGPLKAYDGRPFWQLLGECAGVHGTLSNHYQASGDAASAAQAKARGVAFMRAGLDQLRSDRGLAGREAIQLMTGAVDLGRQSGEVLLQEKPKSGYSQAQLIDLVCTQLTDSHARTQRVRR